MRLLTALQVRVRLRRVVQAHGSQRAAARALGVALSLVNRTLSGEDDPPPKLLTALGLRRVVRYEALP